MYVKPSVCLAILIAIAIIPLFGQLDTTPLNQWDESRLATSALEMLQNHNWLVPHFDRKPDMWSTKPPLMIWLQVGMMKIVGINELAVRLPSAIAGLFTCLLLFGFFSKKLKAPLLGLLCAAVLLTTDGYIHTNHSARNGDYDALLTLFTTAYCLCFFIFIEQGMRKYLVYTFVFLTLSVLTKSVEGLLFIPSLLVYTVYKRKLPAVIKNKDFYWCCAGFLLIAGGYYVLREHYNPGYIAAVRENEWGGRYNNALEGHGHDKWYLFRDLVNSSFSSWYLLVIPGIVAGLFSKKHLVKDITVFTVLLTLLYLIIISGSQTKLEWYMMPMFPFLSIITGVFIFSICSVLSDIGKRKNALYLNTLPYVFAVIIFILPFRHIVIKAMTQMENVYQTVAERDFGFYLRDALHHPERFNSNYSVFHVPFNQEFFWYLCVLKYLHRPVKIIDSSGIKPGMYVLPYDEEARQYLEKNYYSVVLWQSMSLTYYKVNERRMQ